MEHIRNPINLSEYHLKNNIEVIESIVYGVVAFIVPLLMGHPQLLVGILVNAFLIISASHLRGVKLLPVIIAPALGALSRGMLFGPFTIFLVYMVPFIWVGNFVLVYLFKLLRFKMKKDYISTLVIGAVAKSLFLFLAAYILVSFKFIPSVFLTTMGLFQVYTSILGGIVAFGFLGIKRRIV